MSSLSTYTSTSDESQFHHYQLQQGCELTRSPDLILLRNTPKGRGLFAKRDIPAHTILEVSPVLVLDLAEYEEHICKTDLYNYTFNWPCTPLSQVQIENLSTEQTNGRPRKTPTIPTQALVLGIGSMFNHSSSHQNVGWMRNIQNLLITYSTLRDVVAGEELCISYGQQLTFRDVDKNSDITEESWEEIMNGGILDLVG